MIRGLTIKELLIAVTNNVTQDNIQDDPFLVSANLSHCPQPYQLSELYMDDCAPLANFDYYTESRWQVPIPLGSGVHLCRCHNLVHAAHCCLQPGKEKGDLVNRSLTESEES